MFKLGVLLLTTASCSLISCNQSCDFPPSLWCSSLELAQLCKVERQCADYNINDGQALKGSNPVELALYFESECMACKAFITNQLYPVWTDLGSQVLSITLVPYGNAKEKKWFGKWEFTCQHGKDECVGNLIETCAMHLMGNFSEYLTLIHCIEAEQWTAPAEAAAHCAKKMKINMDAINDCVSGDLGNGLEHQMALQTAALNPPHTYVPWITFNGVHDNATESAAMSNLLKVVCEMYKGHKPTACSKFREETHLHRLLSHSFNST